MKATVQTISEPALAVKSIWSVYAELVKARLTALVVVTTLVGFYAGSASPVDFWLMIHTVLGTALVACGAAALNQLLEREYDAKMHRTENRPLPSGRLQPDGVLMVGALLSMAGLLYLALAVNVITSFLGAITLALYVFVYTPLKRFTTLNTMIGAIPGAIPPLMGWTAARGEVTIEGWTLFAILFLWQLPHFLAIAWIYREDYARAGFAMLPVLDQDGHRTGIQAVSHTLGLLPISMCPAIFGMAGFAYLFGAFILGLAFLYFAIQFRRQLSVGSARQLFLVSIIYLPVLLGLLVLDKVK